MASASNALEQRSDNESVHDMDVEKLESVLKLDVSYPEHSPQAEEVSTLPTSVIKELVQQNITPISVPEGKLGLRPSTCRAHVLDGTGHSLTTGYPGTLDTVPKAMRVTLFVHWDRKQFKDQDTIKERDFENLSMYAKIRHVTDGVAVLEFKDVDRADMVFYGLASFVLRNDFPVWFTRKFPALCAEVWLEMHKLALVDERGCLVGGKWARVNWFQESGHEGDMLAAKGDDMPLDIVNVECRRASSKVTVITLADPDAAERLLRAKEVVDKAGRRMFRVEPSDYEATAEELGYPPKYTVVFIGVPGAVKLANPEHLSFVEDCVVEAVGSSLNKEMSLRVVRTDRDGFRVLQVAMPDEASFINMLRLSNCNMKDKAYRMVKVMNKWPVQLEASRKSVVGESFVGDPKQWEHVQAALKAGTTYEAYIRTHDQEVYQKFLTAQPARSGTKRRSDGGAAAMQQG